MPAVYQVIVNLNVISDWFILYNHIFIKYKLCFKIMPVVLLYLSNTTDYVSYIIWLDKVTVVEFCSKKYQVLKSWKALPSLFLFYIHISDSNSVTKYFVLGVLRRLFIGKQYVLLLLHMFICIILNTSVGVTM